MIRVVFDTVIFVRSLINPHSIWGRLIFGYWGRYRVFISPPVASEVVEVLHRPELTRKFRTLRGMNVSSLIELLAQADVVELGELPSVSRDSKDNKFLATAVAADAAYVVTEDEDLLVLKEYRGVKIIRAAFFLRILEEGDA